MLVAFVAGRRGVALGPALRPGAFAGVVGMAVPFAVSSLFIQRSLHVGGPELAAGATLCRAAVMLPFGLADVPGHVGWKPLASVVVLGIVATGVAWRPASSATSAARSRLGSKTERRASRHGERAAGEVLPKAALQKHNRVRRASSPTWLELEPQSNGTLVPRIDLEKEALLTDGENVFLGMNMADYAKWDDEHPARVVKGEFTLRFRVEFLLCDECGSQADAVHLLDDGKDVTVRFSCPQHDFGQYTMDFERLFKPSERFLTHVAEKTWGLRAMAALEKRLYEIYRDRQIEAGILK